MGEPNETTVSDWSEGMTKDDLLGKTMRPKLGPGLGSLKLMMSQVKTINSNPGTGADMRQFFNKLHW